MPGSLKEWLRKALTAYEVEGGRSRIIPMEGLRGLAVLLVFFVHYDALFGDCLPRGTFLNGFFEFLGTVGNCGVDLFFVMSGYLIYGALIRRETGYWKFTKRRVQRIYPTFLAVFALYLALSAAYPQANKIHGSIFTASLYILANLFLLPGIFAIKPIITVAWSLSYEFCFYLTVPILISITRMRRWTSLQRLVAFIVVWIIGGFALVYLGQENRARMISFVAGIVLYELISSSRIQAHLSRFGEFATALGLAGSFAFFYAVHRPRSESELSGFLPILALSAAFFFLALYSFGRDGFLAKLFSWSPLRYLGNMSYSYYLIHGVTLEGIAKIMGIHSNSQITPLTAGVALVLGFGATWSTSSLLFFAVEKRYSLTLRPAATQIKSAEHMSSEVITGQAKSAPQQVTKEVNPSTST